MRSGTRERAAATARRLLLLAFACTMPIGLAARSAEDGAAGAGAGRAAQLARQEADTMKIRMTIGEAAATANLAG